MFRITEQQEDAIMRIRGEVRVRGESDKVHSGLNIVEFKTALVELMDKHHVRKVDLELQKTLNASREMVYPCPYGPFDE